MNGPAHPERRSLEEARAALAAGETERAINLVAHALRENPDARDAYDVAARALEKHGGSGRQGLLFRLCHDHFEDHRHFYELGFDFMAADLPHLARPLLDRALRLAPESADVRTEYAVALAETGEHDAALEALSGLPEGIRENRASIAFLAAWCRLLTGDVDGAGRGLDRLDRLAETVGVDAALRERLCLGIERMRALGSPGPDDLRGWHFVQYGGALLSTSDLVEMGGRYGVLVESFEALGQRLALLVALLLELGVSVTRVATPSARDAEILGRALASKLTVPEVQWPRPGAEEGTTLLCAGTPDDIETTPELMRRDPATLLYVHKLAWTRSAPLVPDVAGLIAQAHFFPWSRTLKVDAAERRVVEQPPDRRSPAEIAEYLATRIPDRPAGELVGSLEPYVRHRALSLYAGDERVKLRPGFRQESPVPGNRFV